LDTQILGARIRQARESRGLSQEELASLVSRDQRAISEYENGKRKLAAADIPTFAEVLDVPILYFFEAEMNLEDMDRAMLSEFRELPTSEAKKAAIEVVQILAKAIKCI
jgi:transcriptional regulator with XRE-family HTH domain